VLGGGFEPGSTVLVAGPPGAGKTIMAQQICFASATPDHKALYYTTLSEPHAKLVKHLEQFDFFEPEMLGAQVEHVHLGDILREGTGAGLGSLVSEIIRKTMDAHPCVVVIDSAKMLREYVDESELRAAFYDFTSRIGHLPTVLLLLGEYTPEEMAGAVEFSLADGIIQLSYEPREPVDRRWLRVVKMRGGRHLDGKQTLQITGASGVEVFPRVETLLPAAKVAMSGVVPSGVPGLDDLMRGGVPAGDATLVLGPSGAGKTILGLHYVSDGVDRGENCLYVTFQDTDEQLMWLAGKLGLHLEKARDTGQLKIAYVPMGSLDLDILAGVIRAELAERPVQRVVIDSLAELAAAAREAERFPAYNRSLNGIIRAAGASLLVTSETMTLGPPTEPLGGLMYLFHNVVQLRYIEDGADVGRAVNIIKMRNRQHDMGLYAYTISDRGMTVGEKLEAVAGLLGWTALRHEVVTLSP
jgi:circadian clock protein KaiC